MAERIELAEKGLSLYAARLYNHDYLWFSSFEISKTSATIPIVHNYALSYAISGYSYGVYAGNTPRYTEDLATMPAYATPAYPGIGWAWSRFTQNAINSATLRTDDAMRGFNSPAIGWRVVLDPTWKVILTAEENTGFHLYLFARTDFRPPCVFRLGKKGCSMRAEWQELASSVAVFSSDPVSPTHAVNPLDVQGDIMSYEPVALPPHLILRTAEITHDWFVFNGRHRVHLPRRFTPSGALQLKPAEPRLTGRRRRRAQG